MWDTLSFPIIWGSKDCAKSTRITTNFCNIRTFSFVFYSKLIKYLYNPGAQTSLYFLIEKRRWRLIHIIILYLLESPLTIYIFTRFTTWGFLLVHEYPLMPPFGYINLESKENALVIGTSPPKTMNFFHIGP